MRDITRRMVLTVIAILALPWVADRTGAVPASQSTSPAKIRIVLVGDSTVTRRSGWGYGFELLLDDGVECVNEASGGRSSRSFIDEGKWQAALARRGDYYLIQFGHNDEPGKGPERETDPGTSYRRYMARYVDDARAIGARPILVTSLARRIFVGRRVESRLTPYAEAVLRLAAEKQVPVIDLHAGSLAMIQRMGEDAWAELSPRDAKGQVDRTHLNARGSVLVARLVASELRRQVPEFAPHIRTEPLAGPPALQRVANAIVAADGSAQFRTVQEAVNAAPQNSSIDRPWIIYIRAGRYRELVYIQREKRFLALIGEDAGKTTITYDLHASMTGLDGKPIGTFRTPTVTVDADDFTAENLTFENGAGAVGQALALRVDGDRAVFRNSRFLGWQDTIFLNRGRHYFEDSMIAGHVDFIFGGATAYFERCHIHAWANGYITAASTPMEQTHGFVISNSRITGEPGVRTFLGRPWRDFAQVTFQRTAMSEVIRPEGWHNWDRPEREKSTRYFEAANTGPGSDAARRVNWVRRSGAEAEVALTVTSVLQGLDAWDPDRLPPYPSGVKATAPPFPSAPGPTRR
jgi:pectinesterase